MSRPKIVLTIKILLNIFSFTDTILRQFPKKKILYTNVPTKCMPYKLQYIGPKLFFFKCSKSKLTVTPHVVYTHAT